MFSNLLHACDVRDSTENSLGFAFEFGNNFYNTNQKIIDIMSILFRNGNQLSEYSICITTNVLFYLITPVGVSVRHPSTFTFLHVLHILNTYVACNQWIWYVAYIPGWFGEKHRENRGNPLTTHKHWIVMKRVCINEKIWYGSVRIIVYHCKFQIIKKFEFFSR